MKKNFLILFVSLIAIFLITSIYFVDIPAPSKQQIEKIDLVIQ
tara:strand:- start:377 stop:505 length:129 start_codon:yes stop_codon:yes gene_type:complete